MPEIIECKGIKFAYDPKIITPKVRESLTKQRYEQKEAGKLSSIIEPKERILELGAGLGFISTICAKHKNTEAVRCYEADPRLIPFIEKTHILNDVKVDLINAALTSGPSSSSVEFYVHENFWGSTVDPNGGHYVDVVSVPSETLDNVLKVFKPTFLICDIEGGEVSLFENSNLSTLKKILVEIHTHNTGRRAVQKMFSTLIRAGFVYDEFSSNGSVILFVRVEEA